MSGFRLQLSPLRQRNRLNPVPMSYRFVPKRFPVTVQDSPGLASASRERTLSASSTATRLSFLHRQAPRRTRRRRELGRFAICRAIKNNCSAVRRATAPRRPIRHSNAQSRCPPDSVPRAAEAFRTGSLSRWGGPIGRPFYRPVKKSDLVPAQLTDPSQLSISRSA
jgi:hypothetical protein